MNLQNIDKLRRLFDYLVVVASVVLIVAISIEVLAGSSPLHVDGWYVRLQLAICSIFIADFFISMSGARDRKRYFWSHLPILIISIPYLSLPYKHLFTVEHDGQLLIALIPVLRSFVAIYILLRWLIRGESALRLLYAYVLSLLSFTYVSALIFYECELPLNDSLATFGDAIWWAAMALTTTELTITPVTTVAKILAVILPMSGMMLLPIATNYLFSMRKRGGE
ncbi:MAG: potassium channel family protein [Rikenellaceae bacterium]